MGAMFACGRPEADASSRTTQAEADLPRRLNAPLLRRGGMQSGRRAQTALSMPALWLASPRAISRNIRRTMGNKCSG
jgi:hypothetical protein